MKRPGTVTRAVEQAMRGRDSAVHRLWDFYESRLLRRAAAVVRDTDVGSQQAEDIASEIFAEFVLWLRDSASVFENRKSVWAQLSMATWKRGLRIREHESARRRLEIWLLDNPDDDVEAGEGVSPELLDELMNGLADVHDRAPQIMDLLVDGNSVHEIATQMRMPVRTVYRIVRNCRSRFFERWYA